jgi:lipoate-protein ligase A
MQQCFSHFHCERIMLLVQQCILLRRSTHRVCNHNLRLASAEGQDLLGCFNYHNRHQQGYHHNHYRRHCNILNRTYVVETTISSQIQKHWNGSSSYTTSSRLSFSSSSSSSSSSVTQENHQKVQVCYLDLRGSGLSILERLVIEECILKHDTYQRNWIICGTHTATPHKYLQIASPLISLSPSVLVPVPIHSNKNSRNAASISLSDDLESSSLNDAVAIVMGIGGKPNELLHVDHVRRDQVMVLKRFTGGGTVVLDHDSIWTTIIGRPNTTTSTCTTAANANTNNSSASSNPFDRTSSPMFQPLPPQHHPRPIMEYTANTIYQPTFERLTLQQKHKSTSATKYKQNYRNTLIMESKSCSWDNSGRVVHIPVNDPSPNHIPTAATTAASEYTFALCENDYVLHQNGTNEMYKMGGNAQAITKNGFLHHTSFVWDYDRTNMEQYLSLPRKRPSYRGDRTHSNFLLPLQQVYPTLQKQDFFTSMYETCQQLFQVERMSLRDVMHIMTAQGGIQTWYDKQSRTKIIHNL